MERWAKDCFLKLEKPFRVHNIYRWPSWLERYSGPHPPEVIKLWEDLENQSVDVAVRGTEDVESLIDSTSYKMGRMALKWFGILDRVYTAFERFWKNLRRSIRRVTRRRQRCPE